MTFKEFNGKNVEEAIRTAMREFGSDLSDLDIEILSQGSRGILGVGGEDARILAAPKSAVAAADTVRMAEPAAEPADEADGSNGAEAPAALDTEGDQVAELARMERNARGGRGGMRGSRPRGERGGRERGGEGRVARAPRREPREPREPRTDRPPREPAPFIPAKPLEELTDAERSAIEGGRDVVTEMLRLMGVDATVEITMGSETSKLNVKGSDLGVLIGRRGEKLASLQHLVNLIVAKREGEWHRIVVDIENYRGRREEQLRDVADRAAKRVIQSGKIIQLEPMPAIERRIVHMALVENPKVRTQSVGVEPNRRIVVLPASKADS
ncbi:MAG TPA: RNA-binding cell elongation regulator Jag/EloR [Candidatus Limnocylindria bacterium]|jgi:spoIIIJ-associated protein|nr:RNA-binding cell elongation regulator Jag/EloR [Candidatus Limnocylindria bacterium]